MKATFRAAALIDGTALYFRSREGRSEQSERLDYEALNRKLIDVSGAVSFEPAIFFTTYDAQNENQAKFLAFLQTRLRWQIEPRPVWEADPLPKEAWERGERRSEYIRFDSSIAFALGRLVERRDGIIVVTDSFGLAQPMLAAAEYKGAEIGLGFFSRHLDPRWLPIVRGGDDKISFYDFDEYDELFGRKSATTTKRGTTLAHLK
ncbi:MAG TPA: hypothetical protein VH678_09460 [Xanthobacteraceae bacterium]